jgi:hypothetical protein
MIGEGTKIFRIYKLAIQLTQTDIKVLNHILLTLSKKQNLTKFFTNNKSVESTDHETGLSDAASREVSIENTDEGSKAEKDYVLANRQF